ncbi:MAG: MBL fold metallo-hydrolase [Anaerolineales bacterium]|nr:MAG: MBL fold metallo-hydrolase [Anaerolineales bacterium]
MKATYALFESASGAQVHRLPLQAFPNFWAYAYLVATNDKLILIDTGSGTDSSHEDLLNGLHQAGYQPSDLTHILLTHAHIDHFGGLTQLKPLTSAKIGCHELDASTVSDHDTRLAFISHRLASFLTESGLASDEADSLLSIYRFTKALYRSVPVDFTYNEIGAHLPNLDVIHLPGHCPGHVAIRLDDIIFCGDMVVTGVTPHLAPESISPFSGLDHYLESLEKFHAWAKDARLILNGHDDVINDLPAQIEATHKNILRRMSKAVESLSEPRTIAEVCNYVYENPAGYTQLLAIEKTGAYLEYLYERGMIEIVNPDEVEQGLPAKYHCLRDDLVMLLEKDLLVDTEIGKHVHAETSSHVHM